MLGKVFNLPNFFMEILSLFYLIFAKTQKVMSSQKTLLKVLTIAVSCILSFRGFTQEMVINNPGQLYSTYKFTEPEKETIKKQVSSYEFEKVLKYCNEGSWPSGIS